MFFIGAPARSRDFASKSWGCLNFVGKIVTNHCWYNLQTSENQPKWITMQQKHSGFKHRIEMVPNWLIGLVHQYHGDKYWG